MRNKKLLCLASSSITRKNILTSLGFKIDKIISPQILEIPKKHELPRDFVQRIASEKLLAVKNNQDESFLQNNIILAADTVVAVGQRILQKPKNEEEARKHLSLLSGRRHQVITAICLWNGTITSKRINVTTLKIKSFSPQEIEKYLKTNEWQDKAGGYAIQGYAETFVTFINGSYSNVLGLPSFTIVNLLNSVDIIPQEKV